MLLGLESGFVVRKSLEPLTQPAVCMYIAYLPQSPLLSRTTYVQYMCAFLCVQFSARRGGVGKNSATCLAEIVA